MYEVNANLYDFLKKNETGLYTKDFEKNKTVFAYVHIDFTDIQEFVNIVGADHFSEGGEQVILCQGTIVVELNGFFECDGHYLSSYKSCFSDHEWDHYKGRIEKMESDTHGQ